METVPIKVMEPYILVHFVNKFLLFCFVLFSFLSLSLYSILKVLEVVAPFKHFNKLKEFVAMKLPAGFPVRIGLFCFVFVHHLRFLPSFQ